MIEKILREIKKQFESFRAEILNFKSNEGRQWRRRVLTFAAIVVTITLAVCVISDLDNKAVRVLYVGNDKVGIIDSPRVYENARDDAESIISEKYSIAYKFPADSAYYKISTRTGGALLTKQEISDYLVQKAENQFATGYGLYIDDKLVAVGANHDDVQSALDDMLDMYSKLYAAVKTDNDIIIMDSHTKIVEMKVPDSLVKTKDEIMSLLGLDELSQLNQNLSEDKLLSDELSIRDISLRMPEIESITETDISMSIPSENIYYVGNAGGESTEITAEQTENGTTMSFTSYSIEVVTEILPCEEQIIYDKTLKKGKKMLVNSGVYGRKETTYEVTYRNGEELIRTLLSEEIVKEPVAKVYRVGTKIFENSDFEYVAPGDTLPGPTGTFILPTSGKLTSTFSGRDLFGRIEFHGAVDIANKQGTPVYASDGGTVILAEWFSTYGNCVIIDHGNGLKTLYAHLSKYSVQKGDIVGQGWQIGAIGMTGRVTGAHLHFEVMQNDIKVDPLKYIQ